jgi:hypothetical protein
MKITLAKLNATLDQHTVDVAGGGVVAGFLVRCLGSGKELGYIWTTGNVWRWRTCDRTAWGERSTQRAAVETVVDAYAVSHGQPLSGRNYSDRYEHVIAKAGVAYYGSSALPPTREADIKRDAPRAVRATPVPVAHVPVAPTRHVVWSTDNTNAHGITAATADALKVKP